MTLKLFALNGSERFGTAVAATLGVALSAHEEIDFDDGEHKTRPLESVRGCDVYVLHALHGEATASPNDKLIRLLFFAGALRDASAARVTAVLPYLCYLRKDRRSKARDPVSSRYIAQLIEAIGIARVVTIDAHNVAAYQNAFRIPAEHLEAAGLFVAELARLIGNVPAIVIAPDVGAMKRAEALRERLEKTLGRPVPRGVVDKIRSGGIVSGGTIVGDLAGRAAVIVDDLISTGTTLSLAARACREQGAQQVYAAVTHGLFSRGASTVITEMPVDGLLVTDTVRPAGLSDSALAKLRVITAAPLFASAIARIHRNGSLTDLLDAPP